MEKASVRIISDGKWILGRMATELLGGLTKNGFSTSMGMTLDNSDIHYYINYDLVRTVGKSGGINVGYFTHIDPDYVDRWQYAESVLDYGIYMADRYKPSIKGTKIYPTGCKISKKIRVGVSGRKYSNGRKREKLLRRLSEMDNVTLCSLGDLAEGIGEVTEWKSDSQASEWYRSLDVFVSLSSLEGGSVPHFEAIKYGVPVRISFDVGNIEEWGRCFVIVKSINEIEDVIIQYMDILGNGWEYFIERNANFLKGIL